MLFIHRYAPKVMLGMTDERKEGWKT